MTQFILYFRTGDPFIFMGDVCTILTYVHVYFKCAYIASFIHANTNFPVQLPCEGLLLSLITNHINNIIATIDIGMASIQYSFLDEVLVYAFVHFSFDGYTISSLRLKIIGIFFQGNMEFSFSVLSKPVGY